MKWWQCDPDWLVFWTLVAMWAWAAVWGAI